MKCTNPECQRPYDPAQLHGVPEGYCSLQCSVLVLAQVDSVKDLS